MRNWGIRQLRALHAQCHMLSGERRDRAWAAIDEELAARGAETEAARRLRLNEEWAREEADFSEVEP
jgi:hypothetical protein